MTIHGAVRKEKQFLYLLVLNLGRLYLQPGGNNSKSEFRGAAGVSQDSLGLLQGPIVTYTVTFTTLYSLFGF